MYRPSLSTCHSTLRIFHATDIHFLVEPTLRQIVSQPKRLIGVTNLYLLRRAERFSRTVQQQLIRTIIEHKPDIVILSGDLTNLSTRDEFTVARDLLEPILNNGGTFPTFIIPGNHDSYTPDAVEDVRGVPTDSHDSGTRGVCAAHMMREYFGEWMESLPEQEWKTKGDAELEKQIRRQQEHFMKFPSSSIPSALRVHKDIPSTAAIPLPYLPIFSYSFLRIIGLNPCRPTRLGSKGEYVEKQLEMLSHILKDSPIPSEGACQPWQPIDPISQQQRLARRFETLASSPLDQPVPTTPSPAHQPTACMPFQSTFNLLVGHYPILDGFGNPYEQQHKWHGVENGERLRRVLQDDKNIVHPNLFLHGHVHRGYQDQLQLGYYYPRSIHPHQMLICNSGSSGQSFSQKSKRSAAFNVYTIHRGGEIVPPSTISSASSTTPFTPLTPRRSFPMNSQPPLPFPRSPKLTQEHIDSSPYHTTRGVNKSNGARGGVQSIFQPSSNRNERYFTTVDRWIHNGDEFVQEEFPYTSGY